MTRPLVPDPGVQVLVAFGRCLTARIERFDGVQAAPGTLREVRGIAMQVLYDAVLRPVDEDERVLGVLCKRVSVDVLMLAAAQAVLNWWLPDDLQIPPSPELIALPEVPR